MFDQNEQSGQTGGQVVPSGQPPQDDAKLSPALAKGAAEQSLAPKESLVPRGVDPRMRRSNLGTELGMATLKMFVPMLGGAIQHHIKAQKEAQISEATNEFMALDAALEMASTMAGTELGQGKITQDKLHERTQELWKQQPGYKALFDPNNPAAKKRLKNFAKVFQVDWMNPEKKQDTVHYQALQRFMELKPASMMVKMAAQQFMNASQGMSGKPPQGGQPQGQPPGGAPQPGQQPQGGPPQDQPPQGPQGTDLQTRIEKPDLKGLTQYGDYLKALEQHQNHFEFHADESGRSVAFDRRTGEAKDVKVDGESVKMMTRAKDGIANVDNKPVGVYRQGKLRVPGDANWTGEDQKQFDAAQATWAAAEAMKDHRVQVSAAYRASAWQQTRAVNAYDTEQNAMVITNMRDISEHPGKYAPPSQSMQVLNRDALFREINYTSGMVRQAIGKLGDEPFPQELRAQLAIALRSEDPKSYWQEFLRSNAADKLTTNQIEYITGLISLEESALSLRSLGGMGQGSDQLRTAIIKMLPGAGTPSGSYAKRQMDLFEGEVKKLKSTLPKLGTTGKGEEKKPAGNLKDAIKNILKPEQPN